MGLVSGSKVFFMSIAESFIAIAESVDGTTVSTFFETSLVELITNATTPIIIIPIPP